jgi:hypothetical protein
MLRLPGERVKPLEVGMQAGFVLHSTRVYDKRRVFTPSPGLIGYGFGLPQTSAACA